MVALMQSMLQSSLQAIDGAVDSAKVRSVRLYFTDRYLLLQSDPLFLPTLNQCMKESVAATVQTGAASVNAAADAIDTDFTSRSMFPTLYFMLFL